MITAIDTNILLDILIPNAQEAESSKTLLDDAYSQGAIVISEVVYAELASQFTSQTQLHEFLQRTGIRVEDSQPDALYAASQAWQSYNSKRNRINSLQCPACGEAQSVLCVSCGESIRIRQHILADFLIGGHALQQADKLLTRDRGYYRTYFPTLTLQ